MTHVVMNIWKYGWLQPLKKKQIPNGFRLVRSDLVMYIWNSIKVMSLNWCWLMISGLKKQQIYQNCRFSKWVDGVKVIQK